MSNYIQIKAQIEKLQKEAEAVRKREISETIANIKKAIQAFGLTAEDLGLAPVGRGRKKPNNAGATKRRGRPAKADKKTEQASAGRKRGASDRRSTVAPKYRDRSTGATWTGRGKQPKWLVAALAAGQTLDDFRI